MTPKEILDILEAEIGTIPKKENEAQQWFKDAYIKGSKAVQLALLELIDYRVVIPKDDNEKIMWIFRDVLHGRKNNRKELRQMFYEGHGEENIRKEIVDFMILNTQKDDLESIIFMGHIHSAGFNVEKNIDIAHNWYKKAANKGNVGAQLAVGDYHYHKEEYEAAHTWYLRAGKQDNKTAFIRLSRMYTLGQGVDIDNEKAKNYKNKVFKTTVKASKKLKITPPLGGREAGKKKIRVYKPKSKKK